LLSLDHTPKKGVSLFLSLFCILHSHHKPMRERKERRRIRRAEETLRKYLQSALRQSLSKELQAPLEQAHPWSVLPWNVWILCNTCRARSCNFDSSTHATEPQARKKVRLLPSQPPSFRHHFHLRSIFSHRASRPQISRQHQPAQSASLKISHRKENKSIWPTSVILEALMRRMRKSGASAPRL
jgi:hypothetical protein